MSYLSKAGPTPSHGYKRVGDYGGGSLVASKLHQPEPGYENIELDRHETQDGGREQCSAFIQYEVSQWKKAFCAWRDNGIYQALEILAEYDDSSKGLANVMARSLIHIYHSVNSLAGRFHPHYLLTPNELCERYSTSSDWLHSPVRCMAWHNQQNWLAIAREDDRIEVRVGLVPLSSEGRGLAHQVCELKDSKQTSVTCMQWRPFGHPILAVGTETGIAYWRCDPSAAQSKLTSSLLRFDQYPGHVPVTSVAFSPDGDLLVSACPTSSAMLVWSVSLGVATPLQRIGGGGMSLVTWSPDGQQVFAGTPSAMFRVWQCDQWVCDRWTNLSGRCMASCWSPLGDYLLFAVERDSAIYCLHTRPSAGGLQGTAIKCVDVTPYEHDTGSTGALWVGGWVKSMCWDPSGERLAVMFTEDSPGGAVVSVFRTSLKTELEVTAGGFIRGVGDEAPRCISFTLSPNGEPILTTAWSSGRISFVSLTDVMTPAQPYPTLQKLNQTQLYSLSQHKTNE